jgi:hypothetical protein
VGILTSFVILSLLQMNVSALEGELSRAMAQKAQTSAALSEALAVKLTAEQRLNSILVSGMQQFLLSSSCLPVMLQLCS